MKRTKICTSALLLMMAAILLNPSANAQDAKTPYPNMAPLDRYLMADRNAEMALAKSAAPASISDAAEIWVLTGHGYETAAKGKNGFVCLVQRSWTAGLDDPDFWNPKLRAPICYNAPAVRFYLPRITKKTDLILAGRSKQQMADAVQAAIEKKDLPQPETGAMCYMLSKQGYLNDHDGHWRPHLMFFLPQSTPAASWGAGLPDTPVIEFDEESLSVFLIPVARWSDGTVAPNKER